MLDDARNLKIMKLRSTLIPRCAKMASKVETTLIPKKKRITSKNCKPEKNYAKSDLTSTLITKADT